MDLDKLFEITDIEEGEDFQYFENFAELAELDDEIEVDVLSAYLAKLDMKTFAELCESYFYDVSSYIPDSQVDVYNLLENIKRNIVGLCQSVGSKSRSTEDGNDFARLVEEFNKFRNWYNLQGIVQCRNLDDNRVCDLPLRDAIALVREEKLGGASYKYDFSRALEYSLDEYIMSYADLLDEDE